MATKNKAVLDSPFKHTDLLVQLFTASAVLESMALLHKHHNNQLGDDSGQYWYRLWLILEDVQQSLEAARTALEENSRYAAEEVNHD